MKSSREWRDEKYREVYDSNLSGLERRKQIDPSFAIEDAEGILSHLYIQEGNDWTGRGELQDLVLGATIAAHEHFIAVWRSAIMSERSVDRSDPLDTREVH